MTWTDERIALLTDLWTAGKTGSECAEALGISRNAALGKAYRLGLPARVRATPKPMSRPRAPRPPKPVIARPAPAPRPAKPARVVAPPPAPMPPKCHPVSLMAVVYGQCRFPVAGWAGPDAPFYCGSPSTDGRSYCRWHQRIAEGGGTASERVAHQADKRVFA